MQQPFPISQSFWGAVAVAVVGAVVAGVILHFLFLESHQPIPAPSTLIERGRVAPTPVPPAPETATRTFVAPVGVTKTQITQCVQRNSTQFVQWRDYSLEDESGSFGEVLVKLYQRDQTLEDLLRQCSKARAN